MQVALFVGVASLAGSVLAAAIDINSNLAADSPTLQGWVLISQVAAAAGLLRLGVLLRSTSFLVLGALIGLIAIEEAFHVLNPIASRLADLAQIANEWTSIRLSVLSGALIYGLVALAGLLMLVWSHRHGSQAERRVVRNLAWMLLAGGFFGGPISVLSTLGNGRRWLFIEEFGESVVFAVIVGYVAGLVVLRRREGDALARLG